MFLTRILVELYFHALLNKNMPFSNKKLDFIKIKEVEKFCDPIYAKN